MTLRYLFNFCGLALGGLFTWTSAAAPDPSERVDFSSQIRPILSAKCYPCHGPDEAARKAKLRIDLREEAIATHKQGRPIDLGNPSGSEILKRVMSSDPEEVMPPPEAKWLATVTTPRSAKPNSCNLPENL